MIFGGSGGRRCFQCDMTDLYADAFVNSRMGVESLPYPKDVVFQRVKEYFPQLESQGFRPPDEAVGWKALRPENRLEEFAKSLPKGRPWRKFVLVRRGIPSLSCFGS